MVLVDCVVGGIWFAIGFAFAGAAPFAFVARGTRTPFLGVGPASRVFLPFWLLVVWVRTLAEVAGRGT